MPTTEMRFSDLTTASVLNDDDILALAKVDQTSASGYMSYKATMIAIGLYITKLANYTSDLQTTDKTIIGAINELKQLIALIPQFDIQVVEELPTEDISETTIYLVPSQNPETENAYDEFIYVDNEWEQVGSTAVDLSAYYTKLEVNGLLDLKESKADMEDDVTEILEDLSDDVTVTGNPVTFETINGGMAKSCEVTMLPIQDLHGYEYPWAGGNGKNKIDQSSITKLIRNGAETSSGITNSDGEITVTYTYGNQGSYSLSQVVPIHSGEVTISADFMVVGSSGSAQIRTNVGNNTSSISATPTPNKTITLSAFNTWENKSVTYALNEQASDGITIALQASASGHQLKIKNLQVEIGSTATSYAPYENICPISGWNGVNLTRTGKNIVDYSTATANTDYYAPDGTKSSSANIKVLTTNQLSAGNYTITSIYNGSSSYPYTRVNAIDKNGDFISRLVTNNTRTTTITLSSPCCLQLAVDVAITSLQLELGSTATAYEEYSGQTYPATFDNTIPGGTYDFVSGDGGEVWKDYLINDLTLTYSSSGQLFTSSEISGLLAPASSREKIDGNMCEFLKNHEVTGLESGQFAVTTDGRIRIKIDGYTTESDLKTAFGSNKFTLKIATPTPFSTTPANIPLNKGTNVVSTDADELKLVASKLANVPDLLTYIQSLEARIKALEEE